MPVGGTPCQGPEVGHVYKNGKGGQPRWRSGLAPPAAQGMILETWDRVPHRALCMVPASLLLPLPVSLPLSLCLYE